jgi:hypothetical protein
MDGTHGQNDDHGRGSEQGSEQGTEQGSEQGTEQGTEQGSEQGSGQCHKRGCKRGRGPEAQFLVKRVYKRARGKAPRLLKKRYPVINHAFWGIFFASEKLRDYFAEWFEEEGDVVALGLTCKAFRDHVSRLDRYWDNVFTRRGFVSKPSTKVRFSPYRRLFKRSFVWDRRQATLYHASLPCTPSTSIAAGPLFKNELIQMHCNLTTATTKFYFRETYSSLNVLKSPDVVTCTFEVDTVPFCQARGSRVSFGDFRVAFQREFGCFSARVAGVDSENKTSKKCPGSCSLEFYPYKWNSKVITNPFSRMTREKSHSWRYHITKMDDSAVVQAESAITSTTVPCNTDRIQWTYRKRVVAVAFLDILHAWSSTGHCACPVRIFSVHESNLYDYLRRERESFLYQHMISQDVFQRWAMHGVAQSYASDPSTIPTFAHFSRDVSPLFSMPSIDYREMVELLAMRSVSKASESFRVRLRNNASAHASVIIQH